MHEVNVAGELNVAVITVSDTRDIDTDKGGSCIIDMLNSSNMRINITGRQIVKDDKKAIVASLHAFKPSADAVLLTGGTGIAKRDVTIEAVRPLFNKELEGFGELFRMLSYTNDVGSKSMLSRAVAGIVDETVIFCLPGSTGAVKLAMESLILPELEHIVSELRK